MAEKENEEVGFTKISERYSACFGKRHGHARGKIRLSGKSGGLELMEDSSGCVAREGRGQRLLCVPDRLHLPHPHPAVLYFILF